MKCFIKILFLWVLLWFCGDVCGRWLVYMKIETSCNVFYGDVYNWVVVSNILCSSLFGEIFQLDKYFSSGLKPPTR